MNNWEQKTIKQSSYLKGRIGWQGLRASEFVEEGAYLITGTDFNSGKIDWNTCYHVTESRFREAPYIHVKNDDLLITKDGTIGKVAYVRNCPDKAVLNSGIFLLRCKDNSYTHKFAYHVLNSHIFDDFLRKNLNGSTINHLYQNVFEKFPFPLPQQSVQKRIATILDCIDQIIEKTEALIHKYQQIKAGLMHDLFTRGLTADGKLRPPREQAPELYQETPIGWIPKEWDYSVMGKYIERYLYGPRFDAIFYSASGNVKTIRGTDFSKEAEILYSQAPVAQLPNVKIGRHILQEGDVVIVTTADCGLTAVFECQKMDFIPSAYTVKYRFSTGVSPYFIKYYMQTSFAKNQVNKYVRQGTLGNLPGSDLLRFGIQIPEEKEQIEIVKRLDSVAKKTAEEKYVLDKLKQQKSGLMHDLLTGKVPIKLDQVEPAHV